MILINLGRQCEWRLELAMLTYRRSRAKLNLLAVSITRHISMVANPNVPISVGKLCNLTPSGGRLSGGVFGQGYVMVSTDHFRREIRSRLQFAPTRPHHHLPTNSRDLYNSLTKLPL